MAIKIDLLPGYVGLRRKLKWALGVSVLLLSSVGSVLTVMYLQKQEDVKVAEADAEMWAKLAIVAGDAKKEADAVEGTLAPYIENVKFFADATQTGPRRAIVLEMIKHFIVPNALISSINVGVDGKVDMVAGVMDSGEYKDLLLNMRLGVGSDDPSRPTRYPPVWSAIPVASGIPGYPVPMEQPVLVTGDTPVPRTFPLSIAVSSQLKSELVFPTVAIPGDVAPPAAGQPGAPR